jgi:hypothetical protein
MFAPFNKDVRKTMQGVAYLVFIQISVRWTEKPESSMALLN